MLKVWLPFNKDNRTIGLSPISATSYSSIEIVDDDTTPNGTGKCGLGGCIYHATEEEFDNDFTIAAWVNNSTNTSWYTGNTIICCKNKNNDTSSTNWYFSVYAGNKLAIAINGSAGAYKHSYTFDLNTWYHVAAVYNGTKYYLYVDGALIGSGTCTNAKSTECYNIGVGGRSKNANGTEIGGVNYRLSDFRIYNHALMDWEIKNLYNRKVFEVNGGLFLEETTNLITGITKGGQTNIVDGEVVTTGTNADTYFTLNLSETIVTGTQYTISCYADMPEGTYWNFPLGTQSNTALTWTLVPGYNKYTFTANDINWGANRIFMDDLIGPARTSGQVCKFYRFQLEKRGSATPLSYGHRDSRVVDIANFNHDITPYNVVKSGSTLYFNGTDAAIKVPIQSIITGGTWSINIWFYRPNGEYGTKSWETLIGGSSGFELSSKAGSNSPKIQTYSWTNSGYTYECDRWNMVTLTRTPSGAKCYLNAELKHNGTAGSVPNNNYFIGAWNTSTQQNFRGYIKDFAVYKKELTQEDITNLYNHGK